MTYFFILGRQAEISVAEILAIFPKSSSRLAGPEVLLMEADNLDPQKLIRRMGGIIKIGEIINDTPINIIRNSSAEKKIKFGFSNYGDKKIEIKKMALTIKTTLKEEGLNCRWVESREAKLSSVIVEQNKLVDEGADICFISDQNKNLIGRTLAVQAFKELSRRDFGRPSRDDASGMLPPKLAQIMINLGAGARDISRLSLHDPFCGSGTILSEALLMGCQNISGSDNSAKATADSLQNLKWIQEAADYNIFICPVEKLSTKIKPKSLDLIISEPYLGPQNQTKNPDQVVRDLNALYSIALQEFSKVLKPNGRVVMIWPIFQGQIIKPQTAGWKFLKPFSGDYQKIFTKLSPRGNLIYARPGQRVKREIIILSQN